MSITWKLNTRQEMGRHQPVHTREQIRQENLYERIDMKIYMNVYICTHLYSVFCRTYSLIHSDISIKVLKHGHPWRDSYRCFCSFLLGKSFLLLCQVFDWLLLRSQLIRS